MPRTTRKVLFRLLLVSIVILATAAALFVYTFDLNRYRPRIEENLSALLGRPVSLGEARLSYHGGLAFDFENLRIGPDDGAAILSARHLYFLVDPLPLLRGDLSIHAVTLSEPSLSLPLSPARGKPSPTTREARVDLPILSSIHSLHIENGSLRLYQNDPDKRPVDILCRNLQGSFSDIAPEGPGPFELRGVLGSEGTTAPFEITGTVKPKGDSWRDTNLTVKARMQDILPPPLFRKILPGVEGEFAGTVSFELNAEGSPASGVEIRCEASGEDLAFVRSDLYASPLNLHSASFEGRWTSGTETEKFENILFELDGLKVGGHATLTTDQIPRVEGEFDSPPLDINLLLSFLPDRNTAVRYLKEKFESGAFRLDSLRLAATFGKSEDARPPIVEHAAFSVGRGAMKIGESAGITDLSFRGEWKGDVLTIESGQGSILDEPFRFEGRIAAPPEKASDINLKLSSTLPSEKLLTLMPLTVTEKVSLSGPIPANLLITGPLRDLAVDFNAPLSAVGIESSPFLMKPVDSPAHLQFSGKLRRDGIDIDHFLLNIGPLSIRTHGHLSADEKEKTEFSAEMEIRELEKAQRYSPLLKKLRSGGGISVRGRIVGSAPPSLQEVSVDLRNASVHLTNAIADINKANGRVLLFKDHCVIDRLSARIGTSLVEIKGGVENFSDPRIDLRVLGQSVRSSDLVFRNEKAYLRDLDGQLRITRDDLFFEKVDVRLDGGTHAVVKGALRNFHDPDLQLDIEADYGNIDEVIALWHGERPRRAEPSAPPPPAHTHDFRIRAVVHEGILGDLKFIEAKGDITRPGGVLTIYPLRFNVGEGSCDAHVAVGSNDSSSILKTSGHVQNMDAAALWGDLLKRKGLVSGSLSGDFYVEGPTGKEFRQKVSGGINLTIRDGILRRFTFLSKVFSILNVSQILTFKLPDMSTEGMPFERINASLSLRNGVVSTEDLFIKSNAMNLSLIGDYNLQTRNLDLILGVKPLRTVDKIVTNIPLAGWILTGKEKALITAHFRIKGSADNPSVKAIPATSLSGTVIGIFKRVFGLPAKIVTDIGELLDDNGKEPAK